MEITKELINKINDVKGKSVDPAHFMAQELNKLLNIERQMEAHALNLRSIEDEYKAMKEDAAAELSRIQLLCPHYIKINKQSIEDEVHHSWFECALCTKRN